ncbi:MAG: hypothetical protein FWE09_06890, partial [Treponema sp.]|nr:hypothetical protein [Treponema sp.]
MKRTIPALAVTAALLLFSCAKGATDDTIDISGVEMPALLLDIVSANRASVFAPLAPDFWEVAAGLLTSDFNPGEDLRIAAAVRALAGSHRAWYGLSEYPSGVPVGTIARAEAASDINHFFDILRYGYAGYGYFGGDAVFHPLREAMHKRLAEMEDTITVDALLEILAHPLREIIFDNHFGIHAFSFNAPPQSAFLNDDFIVRAAEDGYEMTIYGALHKIIEITYATGEPADEPADCIVPTITKDGEIAYAFGLLSRTASYWRELSSVSITVLLENRATGATISHDLALNKVNTPWRYDPRPVEERPLIEERNVRGIAVLENRSMSGVWADAREMYEEHRNFFRVGENARGKPALIIDMRWNYGGLSLLGLEWVRGFSGRPPAAQGLVAFALATHTHEALSEGSSPPGEAND